MAHTVPEDGFREIQLNGKQLVFLFMAATVVSVVIFLCGVLVGRGVRAERGGIADSSALSASTETSPLQTPPATATPASAAPGTDPTKAAPPQPAADDLSYFSRLEKTSAPAEKLKPAAERAASDHPAATAEKPAEKPVEKSAAKPAPAPAATSVAAKPVPAPPASAPATKEATPAAAPETAAEPSQGGFAVQIAALNVRSEAEAIARRLSSKGYTAYVLSPADGKPSVYRVRVGKFNTKREAESIAAKLQKEEQFKPWVTR